MYRKRVRRERPEVIGLSNRVSITHTLQVVVAPWFNDRCPKERRAAKEKR